MRNPNGFGSVVNLGKNRRRPLAVRVTDGYKTTASGRRRQNYKYLEYFGPKQRKEALQFLGAYNSGIVPEDYQPGDGYEKYLSNGIANPPVPSQVVEIPATNPNCPTLEKCYQEWLKFRCSRNKKPSDSTLRNYKIGFGRFFDLHKKRIDTITVSELQKVADSIQGLSKSTSDITKTVITQIYDRAIINNHIQTNFAKRVTWEYTKPKEEKHYPFSEDEIKWLWEHEDQPFVDYVLMMIYTGVRCSEFLLLENKNISLDTQIIIGGIKTEAGINRRIPIHNAILPFFKKYYNDSNYLIRTSSGYRFSYDNFKNYYWNPTMQQWGMDHTPHDTRHTFASLAHDNGVDALCTKLIIGHKVKDITQGVYTHITDATMLAEVNKIQAPF